MIILGLDMSSVTIGHAVHDGREIKSWGNDTLTGDIATKCAQAADAVRYLLRRHQPALVVIESPVARYAKAVLPQARVSGAVLAVFALEQTLWTEVPPHVGKWALTQDRTATKREMVAAAAVLLGLNAGDITEKRGKVALRDDLGPMLTEDEADAIGLALAGLAVKVERRAA